MSHIDANKKGFSLIELLMGVIVAAIVVLMVAALGNISYQSYSSLRSKADVYTDAQFALQLMHESIRQSSSATLLPTAQCLSNCCLTAGGKYYYAYPNANVNANYDWVYSSVACNSSSNTVIDKSLPNNGFPASGSVFTLTPSGSLMTVVLGGTKNNVSFSYTMSASRRN